MLYLMYIDNNVTIAGGGVCVGGLSVCVIGLRQRTCSFRRFGRIILLLLLSNNVLSHNLNSVNAKSSCIRQCRPSLYYCYLLAVIIVVVGTVVVVMIVTKHNNVPVRIKYCNNNIYQ